MGKDKRKCWANCDGPVISGQCDEWCRHIYGDSDNNDSGDDLNDVTLGAGASNQMVGMPAPNMGGQGDPCRGSGRSWYQSKCNWWDGLSCHLSYDDGSSIQ